MVVGIIMFACGTPIAAFMTWLEDVMNAAIGVPHANIIIQMCIRDRAYTDYSFRMLAEYLSIQLLSLIHI